MSEKSKALRKRVEQAEGRRTNWKETYQEAQEYVTPMKENFDFREPGTRRDNAERVFDSTAINGLGKFVSNLQSTLVPPQKQWMSLRVGNTLKAVKSSAEVVRLNKQLETVTDILFSEIHNSNFDTSIAEGFENLAFGSGSLLVQPKNTGVGLNFTSVSLDQLYFERGGDGRISSEFRIIDVPARGILDIWPDFNLEIDNKITKQIKEAPDDIVRLIEGTVPTKVKVPQVIEDRTVMADVPGFEYFVIDDEGEDIFLERQSVSSPWVSFRWSVSSDEVYGRGPILQALPDIKTINVTKEFILKRANMAIAGAYTVTDDGVINFDSIQIEPNAMIPVQNNPGSPAGPTIALLPSAGGFDVGQLVLADLKESINTALFTQPLGPINLPVKTATEIALRQQELVKQIGSSFGRLQFELIVPLVNRCLFVLEEQGAFDLKGFRVDAKTIDIKYLSPLAQAQESDDMFAITSHLEFLTRFFGQNAILAYKVDKLAGLTGELLNVPSAVLQDEQGFAEISKVMASVTSQSIGNQLTKGEAVV